MAGAPVELEWREQAAGILCMYLGGEQTGAATVDVLYGTVNPSGHLAETWPFGFGLSYTDFAYHNLRIDKSRICDTDTLLVQCDVTNTGSCFGKAVMQLYVRDVKSGEFVIEIGKSSREICQSISVSVEV